MFIWRTIEMKTMLTGDALAVQMKKIYNRFMGTDVKLNETSVIDIKEILDNSPCKVNVVWDAGGKTWITREANLKTPIRNEQDLNYVISSLKVVYNALKKRGSKTEVVAWMDADKTGTCKDMVCNVKNIDSTEKISRHLEVISKCTTLDLVYVNDTYVIKVKEAEMVKADNKTALLKKYKVTEAQYSTMLQKSYRKTQGIDYVYEDSSEW